MNEQFECKCVNNANYTVIHGWMIKELHLSGIQLLVYAVIYGFSQAEGHEFCGSLQYLADWCSCTKRSIINALNSMVESGLLSKTVYEKNGVTFCKYSANAPELNACNPHGICTDFMGGEKISPPVKMLHGGGEKISPNNIEDNIDINNRYRDTYRKEIKEDTILTDSTQEKQERSSSVTASCKAVCCTPTEMQRVARAWNDLGLQQITKLSASTSRGRMLNARVKEYGLETVIETIKGISECPFLMGQNDRGWMPTFEWVVKPNNFIKILEGNYSDRGQRPYSERKRSGTDYLMELLEASEREEGK